MATHERDTCPTRILDDIGIGFGVSFIGGFTAWGVLFSSMDCTMVYARQKEDPWNSIIAGAATSRLFSLHWELSATMCSARFDGIITTMFNKAFIAYQQEQLRIAEEEQLFVGLNDGIGGSCARSEGWFVRWFNGGKKEEDKEYEDGDDDLSGSKRHVV